MSVRSLMLAYGDGAKKVWATEFGAPTDANATGYVSVTRQSKILARAISLWQGYAWGGPMIIYNYMDLSVDPTSTNRSAFFGLVRADGVPKPALRMFSSLADGLGSGT
jgi:hypothetical protein